MFLRCGKKLLIVDSLHELGSYYRCAIILAYHSKKSVLYEP
jgi:hypothetical protein